MNKTEVFVGGRVVGFVEGTTFSTRRTSKTLFRRYGGFGLSTEVMAQLRAYDVKTIRFAYTTEQGQTTVYTATLEQFELSTLTHRFWNDDPQKFVPLSKMNGGLNPPAPEKPKPTRVQGDLFGKGGR